LILYLLVKISLNNKNKIDLFLGEKAHNE
jgi:hypothetical protein